jgi:PAS domain S-box-containing protein
VYLAFIGYSFAQVTGMKLLDFAAEESCDLMARNMETESERPYEALGIRKDGATFHIEVVAKAHTYQGRAVQAVAI